ncbi:hypothetical protein ACSNOG_20110, partial [Streptomyces sp. URMC 124]
MSKNAYLRTSAVSLALLCSLSGVVLASAPTAGAAPAVTGAAADDEPADGGYGEQGPEQVVGDENDGFEFFPVAAASKEAPRITRSETIKRAQSWVGKGIVYSGSGSYKGHRTDCSGYVSMAWHLSTDMTTDTYGPNGVTEKIKKSDLKAGDALLNPKSGRYGHVVLFEKWANADHTKYVGYELSGSGNVQHHELPYPYWPGRDTGSYYPVHNKSVVDDVQLPADPGMTEISAGDFTRDGKKDLVAVQVSTGKLFLYPGTGKSGLDTFGDRVEIGSGAWNGMRNLT